MNVQKIGGERAVPASGIAEPPPPAALAAPPPRRPEDSVAGTIAAELLAGLRGWHVWVVLGWDDIRQRYRRSVIGPFWITLSMGAFILLLGLVYSQLFHVEIRTYMPYLAVGYIVWGFISLTTTESCMAFHEASGIIKQIKLPFVSYVLRVVWRNFIVFLHTIVIIVPLAIVFEHAPNLKTLLALPGLFIVCVNVTWVALLLAILSARYRDIVPIVGTMVQIMIFATPIMWPVSALSNARYIAEVNPLYHLIELVREPLLGAAPEPRAWLVGIGVAIAGSTVATALLAAKARRIVFWL